jgi:hypothetical protein
VRPPAPCSRRRRREFAARSPLAARERGTGKRGRVQSWARAEAWAGVILRRGIQDFYLIARNYRLPDGVRIPVEVSSVKSGAERTRSMSRRTVSGPYRWETRSD